MLLKQTQFQGQHSAHRVTDDEQRKIFQAEFLLRIPHVIENVANHVIHVGRVSLVAITSAVTLVIMSKREQATLAKRHSDFVVKPEVFGETMTKKHGSLYFKRLPVSLISLINSINYFFFYEF